MYSINFSQYTNKPAILLACFQVGESSNGYIEEVLIPYTTFLSHNYSTILMRQSSLDFFYFSQ
jgi:hypothetical protein